MRSRAHVAVTRTRQRDQSRSSANNRANIRDLSSAEQRLTDPIVEHQMHNCRICVSADPLRFQLTAVQIGCYTRLLLGSAVTFCYRTRLPFCASTGRGRAVPSAGRAARGVVPFWQAGLARDYLGARPCHSRDCVRGRRITAAQGAGSTVCRVQTARRPWMRAAVSRRTRGGGGGIRARMGHQI